MHLVRLCRASQDIRKATCMSIVRATTQISFDLSWIPKWGVVICLGYQNGAWSLVLDTEIVFGQWSRLNNSQQLQITEDEVPHKLA